MNSIPARATRRPSGFHFLTPVWGQAYTQLYLDVSIPAQLASGNLGAFSGESGTKYIIYTKPPDAERIRSSSAYRKLCELVPVSIELIEQEITVPHDTMSECFRRGIADSIAADAAAVFLAPDLVCADGAFATLKRLSSAGHDVVFVPGIRTIKQGVALALRKYRAPEQIIQVPPRALMKIALENLHPLAHSSWWDEGDGDLIPANLYWQAGSDGILARCFHLHPLLVYSQRADPVFFGTVDDDYFCAACPDASRDYVVTDSDEILIIELSDPSRFFLTGFRKGSVTDVTTWAEQFTNGRHRKLFEYSVRMHAGISDRAAWAYAERKAEFAASAIQQQLRRPLWQLAVKRSPALARRLIRRSQDYRLADANGFPVRPLVEHRLGSVERWLLSLLNRTLLVWQGALRAIRRANAKIYGTEIQPRPWTWQYPYRSQLTRDLSEFLAGSQKPLVVCTDPGRSAAVRLLDESAATGMFAVDGSTVWLVEHGSGQLIGDASHDILVLDDTLPEIRQIEAGLREASRVLRPNGRILIVQNRIVDPMRRSRSEISMTVGQVMRLIRPEFNATEHRLQGGFGSAGIMLLLSWIKLTISHHKLLYRPLVLLSPVLMPLSLIGALLANLLVVVLNRIDRTREYYISSIVAATKAKAAPLRLSRPERLASRKQASAEPFGS